MEIMMYSEQNCRQSIGFSYQKTEQKELESVPLCENYQKIRSSGRHI